MRQLECRFYSNYSAWCNRSSKAECPTPIIASGVSTLSLRACLALQAGHALKPTDSQGLLCCRRFPGVIHSDFHQWCIWYFVLMSLVQCDSTDLFWQRGCKHPVQSVSVLSSSASVWVKAWEGRAAPCFASISHPETAIRDERGRNTY